MLGHSSEALEHANSALAWAQELHHVGSRVHAMDYALVLQKFRGSVDAVYDKADELLSFATEQKLHVHRAKAACFRGWARAMRDDVTGGLNEMLEGISSARNADTPTDFALYYEMLAEIYARAGRLDDGLRAIDDAFAVAKRYGIVFWNAELHRRRGELLLAAGKNAASCFQEALACARSQQARFLELRAAVSLARLCLNDGERKAASEVLRPLVRKFQRRIRYTRFNRGASTDRGVEMIDTLNGAGTILADAPAPSAAAKRYFHGTHRICAPEETLARLQPLLPTMGITRIANVTGLDRTGIPVVMVCRPNARSMTVSQGKGLTLGAAKASGVMEALEIWHAEHIVKPLKLASFDEMRGEHRVADVAALPGPATAATPRHCRYCGSKEKICWGAARCGCPSNS